MSADIERARAVARFLLAAADDLGVRVGCSDDEIITISTPRVPFETIRWLEAELVRHKQAVIAAIKHENLGRAVS
jgi:hypothetical protein